MRGSVRHIHARRGQHIVVHRWRPPRPRRIRLRSSPGSPSKDYTWILIVVGGIVLACILA